VPEVAIAEDRHSCAEEHDVGRTEKCSDVGLVAQSLSCERPAKKQFGLRVRATISSTDL